MSSVVNWCGRHSMSFTEQQGVRQGENHLANLLQDAYRSPPGLATEEQSGSQYILNKKETLRLLYLVISPTILILGI